jgi:hypothetical protein
VIGYGREGGRWMAVGGDGSASRSMSRD